MRVTHNISINTYLRNSRRIESSMLKSITRIETQRRFNRVSEDSINGIKAMAVRRQLRGLKIHKDNINVSKELFNAAEANLSRISDKVYIQMESELVAAANGTHEQMDLDIFAQSFDQMAEEMVKTLNGDFAERKIFGGTSNSEPPFRIEQVYIQNEAGDIVYPPDWDKYYENNDGVVTFKEGVYPEDIPKTVLYNRVPINFSVIGDDELGENITAGNYYIRKIGLDEDGNTTFNKYDEDDAYEAADGAFFKFKLDQKTINEARTKNDNSVIFPGSDPIYVDIGIGIQYKRGTVDAQTALDVSLNGAAITGSGMEKEKDENGNVVYYSKNLIQLALDTAYNLRRGTNVEMEMDLDTANDAIRDLADKIGSGGTLSTEEYSEISKQLQKSKTGAVLLEDEYGNYIVKIGKNEIYNSGVNGAAATRLDASDKSPDRNYVRFTVLGGDEPMTIDVNKYIGDQSFVNAVIDRANIANSHVLMQITTLGTKQNSMDFYLDRITDYEFNLKERQNLVEGTDMEEEIMNYDALNAAYQAALQLGSRVIPRSIFDFI